MQTLKTEEANLIVIATRIDIQAYGTLFSTSCTKKVAMALREINEKGVAAVRQFVSSYFPPTFQWNTFYHE